MRLARLLVPFALLSTVLVLVPAGAGAVTLTARGSVNQVEVTGATPGATVELHQGGPALASGTVDAQGAFVFGIAPGTQDDVARGSGYTVTQVGGSTVPVDKVAWADVDTPEVLGADDTPPQSFYDDEELPFPDGYGQLTPTGDEGFGYVTMRDGTTLSVNVLAPFLVGEGAAGPWPVVIDYSGYTPSDPDEVDPVATLMRVAGFAVVRANLRGTGCSGGVYSYWEPLQGLDGYDLVEAIATQPWVKQAVGGNGVGPAGPMVGMYGISFSGISQLFVGRTNPPSLAAIAPTSVIADTYRSTLYPGGILNDGFAVDWASEREHYAEPAGQAWAAARIPSDSICAANQELKLQAPPLLSRFEPDLLYETDPGDSLAPATFVDEIQVPTFIAGSFQDEQTGGHWSTMLDDFDPGVLKRAVLYNGTHADPITPDVMRDLLEFLDLYVARRPPQQKAQLRGSGPEEFAGIFGQPYAFPAYRGGLPDYQSQAAYEALPPIRVEWERGARDAPGCLVDTNHVTGQPASPRACVPDGEGDGAPYPRVETTYSAWPVPGTTDSTWYLTPDGQLSATAPTVPAGEPRGSSSFRYTTARSQVGTFSGSSTEIWDKDATYDWEAPPEGDALRYVTPPFTQTTAYAGTGSVDLWVRADAPNVDLEVTLTEVRPDGDEEYIQSGWLRASHRQEAPGSTPLAPIHTHAVEEPLPDGQFARVRVELFPFTEIVRPNSRLAITVSAPGGNRPFWHFAADDAAEGQPVDIGHAADALSALHLPLVGTPAATPATVPVCGDLRGQPCRTTPESTRPSGVDLSLYQGHPQSTDRHRFIRVQWDPPEAPGVTGYEITDVVTGESYEVDTADEELDIVVPDHQPPPAGRHSYVVTAMFGATPGAPSDASPLRPGLGGFADVPATAWNAEAVGWMDDWLLLPGQPGNVLHTRDPITRLTFVIWLFNTFGAPAAVHHHDFVDVGNRATNPLSWAEEAGIVAGLPGHRFAPDRLINRAQLTRWLWAAAGMPTGAPPNGFVDVAPGAWYAPAVDWARDAEIVAGFAGNRYRPQANATRGQAVSWLMGIAAWLEAES